MESLDGMKASINRCQVLVESRDPSPFVPACILEDMVLPPVQVGDSEGKGTDPGGKGDGNEKSKCIGSFE
jgi:hypothetical protein